MDFTKRERVIKFPFNNDWRMYSSPASWYGRDPHKSMTRIPSCNHGLVYWQLPNGTAERWLLLFQEIRKRCLPRRGSLFNVAGCSGCSHPLSGKKSGSCGSCRDISRNNLDSCNPVLWKMFSFFIKLPPVLVGSSSLILVREISCSIQRWFTYFPCKIMANSFAACI